MQHILYVTDENCFSDSYFYFYFISFTFTVSHYVFSKCFIKLGFYPWKFLILYLNVIYKNYLNITENVEKILCKIKF